MINSPSLDLLEFIETAILPQYASFDKAHSLTHVQHVINASLKLSRYLGADINMAYVVAAYHDLGLSGPRAIHHITSGKILSSDARLKRWFTPQQIQIMKEAVEDHRASTSHTPRSIYGKIVAEADRDLEPMTVLRRTIQFGLSNYPEKNRNEQYERFTNHLKEKYDTGGYLKLWITGSDNEKNLNGLRTIISDRVKLKQIFDTLYDDETKENH
jgi:uncharacterized protein